MDNIEERNSLSGYLEGNWQPVTKEIHRAVCKVGREKMRIKTGQSITHNLYLDSDLPNTDGQMCRWRGQSQQDLKADFTSGPDPTPVVGPPQVFHSRYRGKRESF